MGFQVGAALLEACVLAVLSKEDTYGYILTQTMRTIVDISESTLYPVLRRLQSEECLTTYDKAFQGRNRRYYAITAKGEKKLKGYKSSWTDFKIQIDNILYKEEEQGKEGACNE